MKIRKYILALSALLFLGGIACLVFDYQSNSAGWADGPEFIFRYAENQPAGYPSTLGAQKFAELVKERSKGRIEIVVFHSGQLGSEKKVVEQLQFGGIDFARISLSQLAEFYQPLGLLQLPYLYRDDAHMFHVLDGEIGDSYLEMAGNLDLVGLSWYHAGSRSFYTTKKQVLGIQDLKGLSIRVQESAVMADLISILGANPVKMAYSEVYSGLQTGKIDGAENNWPSYESMKHYQVAPYIFLAEHSRIPEMQLMSKVSMEKLSEADIALIKECAKESALYEREEWVLRDKQSQEAVLSAGAELVVPTPEEKKKLQAACKPLYEKYANDQLELIDRIIAME